MKQFCEFTEFMSLWSFKLMKLTTLLTLQLLLTGCAPAVTLPTTVKIPVSVPCSAPPPVVRPRLAIASLPQNATANQYVRAVESSLEALMGYAEELEHILGSYRGAD